MAGRANEFVLHPVIAHRISNFIPPKIGSRERRVRVVVPLHFLPLPQKEKKKESKNKPPSQYPKPQSCPPPSSAQSSSYSCHTYSLQTSHARQNPPPQSSPRIPPSTRNSNPHLSVLPDAARALCVRWKW